METAAVLDLRVQALWRHMACRRSYQVQAFREELPKQRERERKRVNAKSGLRSRRWAGPRSGVHSVLTRRDEVNNPQLASLWEQMRVVAYQLARHLRQFIRRKRRLHASILAGLVEAPDVVLQAIRLLLEGPKLVRDRGAQNNPLVVDGQPSPGSGHELSLKVDPRLGTRHFYLLILKSIFQHELHDARRPVYCAHISFQLRPVKGTRDVSCFRPRVTWFFIVDPIHRKDPSVRHLHRTRIAQVGSTAIVAQHDLVLDIPGPASIAAEASAYAIRRTPVAVSA